jgi:hypothetical protein
MRLFALPLPPSRRRRHSAKAGQNPTLKYALQAVGIQVLQRREWHGEPYSIGDLFRLHKDKAGRPLEAASRLPRPVTGMRSLARLDGRGIAYGRAASAGQLVSSPGR